MCCRYAKQARYVPGAAAVYVPPSGPVKPPSGFGIAAAPPANSASSYGYGGGAPGAAAPPGGHHIRQDSGGRFGRLAAFGMGVVTSTASGSGGPGSGNASGVVNKYGQSDDIPSGSSGGVVGGGGAFSNSAGYGRHKY